MTAKAAPRCFPYTDHRTVAEVDAVRAASIAKAQAASLEARIGWCPPHLREDYRTLVPHVGAVEARRTIQRQISAHYAPKANNQRQRGVIQ